MMKCETVKIKSDNEQGFVIVDADKIPVGAMIYGTEEQPKKRGRKPKDK